ncbi:metal-sensing transcriptional repressor [Niameybacter massiliensis]|uniref:metal-sensing transcriptional repressor n=1 Tax=Niameybacter massiliensis TaxID=1658108 RepID=UPI0006B5C9EF|nr:metal-sensing transcriptional repressor [Niameybacter massiliensis]
MKKHSHPNQKQVINRLSRIIGHTEAIKRMCIEEKDCTEVLIQIAAVKSALNNLGKLILQEHIEHCVVHAIEEGNTEALDDLYEALNKFVK